MQKLTLARHLVVCAVILATLQSVSVAALADTSCNDAVVLVHGNAGAPEDWASTYSLLRDRGYASSEIFLPEWGSRYCPTCNDHRGWEEIPVREALTDAIASSCSGKIDVIGHSMGVTLAAQQILKEGKADKVDAFVGIAGAYRGLLNCGVYPYHVWNRTCGSRGLSVSSPFLDWLFGKKLAARTYSIKSWVDQIVCGTGTCYVFGVHSSRIDGEDASYSYNYGHFGLQRYTAAQQYNLIR